MKRTPSLLGRFLLPVAIVMSSYLISWRVMSSVQIIHSRAFRIKKNAKNKSKFLNYNIKQNGRRRKTSCEYGHTYMHLVVVARKNMLQILVVRWKWKCDWTTFCRPRFLKPCAYGTKFALISKTDWKVGCLIREQIEFSPGESEGLYCFCYRGYSGF